MIDYLEIIKDDDSFSRPKIKTNKASLKELRGILKYRMTELVGEDVLKDVDELINNEENTIEINPSLSVDIIWNIISICKGRLLNPPYMKIETNDDTLSKYISDINKSMENIREILKLDEESLSDDNHNSISRMLFNDDKLMLDFLNETLLLNKRYVDFYVKKELLRCMKSIEGDLKPFLDDATIEAISYNLKTLVYNDEIIKAKEYLKYIQGLILNHWNEYVSDVDKFNVGDDFAFICHSTAGLIKNEFHTRFVSTSLITKDVHDTYRNGYGYILPSSKVVGADDKDMYTENYANEVEDLYSYSGIPIIHSPEILIDKCIERRKLFDAMENPPEGAVYNEVIIDGFNPIGIFCITDGTKELNRNYVEALRIKEQYPNLKIVEIDLSRYAEKKEVKDFYNLVFIAKLFKHKYGDNFNAQELYSYDPSSTNFSFENSKIYHALDDMYGEISNEEILEMYKPFIEELNILRSKGDYKLDDICALFEKINNQVVFNSYLVSLIPDPDGIGR